MLCCATLKVMKDEVAADEDEAVKVFFEFKITGIGRVGDLVMRCSFLPQMLFFLMYSTV